ncbi:MAG TPA: hypothetical protein VJ904_10335, partial [Tichowtungia sp.]|nr:hypothetical protein [Tichowtungia sp.]
MPILPKRDFEKIEKSYRRSHGGSLYRITPEGLCEAPGPVSNLPPLVNARAYALRESVRWGEPYTFFLVPNVICWVVPLVCAGEVNGGLVGGEVMSDGDAHDQLETVNHLVAAG